MLRQTTPPLLAISIACSALALGLSAMVACAPGSGQSSGASQAGALVPVVLPPIRPSDMVVVPILWSEAELSFTRAAIAYDIADYHAAAQSFFRVAQLLTLPADGKFPDVYAKNRAYAYQNAALAWTMAGELPEARAKLEKAAQNDPDLHDFIGQLLEGFPPGGAAFDADAGDGIADDADVASPVNSAQ